MYNFCVDTVIHNIGKMLQILHLVRMNGKLQWMDLHMLSTWCDLFVKRTVTISSLLSEVSTFSIHFISDKCYIIVRF